MKMTDPEDKNLARYFEAARRGSPKPSPALMARIAADAHAVARDLRPPRLSVAEILRAALGGWPGLAGLATAGLAGLWIGAASPPAFDPGALLDSFRLDADAVSTGYADLTWSDG